MDTVATVINEAKLIHGASSWNLFIGTQTSPTGAFTKCHCRPKLIYLGSKVHWKSSIVVYSITISICVGCSLSANNSVKALIRWTVLPERLLLWRLLVGFQRVLFV